MDLNKTIDLIIRDLEEAREIIDDLKNYPGIPAIQVELAKSKCKNAAEVIALLKNMQTSGGTETRSQKTEVKNQKSEAGSQKKEIENVKPEVEVREPVAGKRSPVTGIVADTFDNLPDSLNEKLGSLRDEDNVPDYLKSKPLVNLKQAIGVNDRFLFIRELFNGNQESYSQAITKIDEAKSLDDAKAVMLGYTENKSESEAARQLLDLVKRKFPGDE